MGFVTAALDALEWFVSVITPFLNRLTLFFLIAFLGALIGRTVGQILRRLLRDVKADTVVKPLGLKIERPLSIGIELLIYLLSGAFAFQAAGLLVPVLLLIALVFVVVVILTTLFLVKEYMPDLFAGFAVRRRVQSEMHVRVCNIDGVVTQVGAFGIRIRTRYDDLDVPHMLFAAKGVIPRGGNRA